LRYSVDTSALIDYWRRYPPEVFPGLLERLTGLFREEVAVAARDVREELEAGGNSLWQWARQNVRFIEADEEIQQAVVAIQAVHPELSGQNRARCADPFVVALAKTRSLTVVTHEKITRLPQVCEKLGVPCCDLVGMFRTEGWQLR
jgi:hypothetical protein